MNQSRMNMQPDTFTRVNPTHNLDIYRGKDMRGRDALLLITTSSPIVIKSTKSIEVSTGQRKDKRYALMFSLCDVNYMDIFDCFCNDIINTSMNLAIEDKIAYLFFANRYKKWTALFEKAPSEILSSSEVKGLIGEMLVLKNILIPQKGETCAIESWMGPLSTPQDFIFEESWMEVKTISSSSESIHISSVEQLDSDNNGQIVVVRLDKSNEVELKAISLNEIYNEMLLSIQNPVARSMFEDKLIGMGYCSNPRYDEFRFSLKKMEIFKVNVGFPKITRKAVDSAITKVEYDILIPAIEKFKAEEICS